MILNAARVFVRDIVAARQFYAGVLGLPLKVDGSGWGYCVFDGGAAELVVEQVGDDAPAEDRGLVGRFTGLSFEVADAAARHQALQAQGVVFDGPPERQSWGGILATFEDPSGNTLQICQKPAAA
jgi:catechol 2,3-dioxygenase-like lactoylglutathione lyase family enzyme